MQIGDVSKRSRISIERKVAKDIQFGYKEDILKLYRVVERGPDQEALKLKYFEKKINIIDGFNYHKFKGECNDNLGNGEIDKTTRKYLFLSSYIVGESDSGLCWLIKLPLNDLTISISKKYIPELKKFTLEDIANLKKDKVVEIYWHLDQTITISNWINNEITSYLGRKKVKSIVNIAETIHIVAIASLIWEMNKIRYIALISHISGKVNKKLLDQNIGEEFVTEEDIINQLIKNSNIRKKAIYYEKHEDELKQDSSSPPLEDDASNNSPLWD